MNSVEVSHGRLVGKSHSKHSDRDFPGGPVAKILMAKSSG